MGNKVLSQSGDVKSLTHLKGYGHMMGGNTP